jgi:hypothetical protein
MQNSFGTLGTATGIGLRPEHYDAVLAQRPDVGFLEVHSENYFGAGGRPLDVLEQARRDYPISLHGVGLSLGSVDPLDRGHLRKLRALADRFAPALISEHLSWGSVGGIHLNDLLPLPYTDEAQRHLVDRILAVQEFLGRRILVENPSSYLEFTHSTMPEREFLVEVARASGCGILLDVNNVHVSAVNHGYRASDYLAAIPAELVGEIHLAGHNVTSADGATLLIDTHDRPVSQPVWELFRIAVERFPDAPALVEWDAELPSLDRLVAEAHTADRLREERHALAA